MLNVTKWDDQCKVHLETNNNHSATLAAVPVFKSRLIFSLDGSGAWGRMGISLYMAESLHCPPEAVTALLIGYTPMQNEKLKKVDQFYFIEGFFFFFEKDN